MWFRQAQIFQLCNPPHITSERLTELFESLMYKPCLATMPLTMGWCSVIDEPDAPVVRGFNGCYIFCLLIEEKILPATVVRQHVNERIKQLEASENRKVYKREIYALKDEVTQLLLTKAFSKFSRVYAYIDTRHNWLVLGTTNKKKTEQFFSIFKKVFSEHIQNFKFKKGSTVLTHWLKHQDYPTNLAIEKSAVLQDPMQQTRVIRCQQQNLFNENILSFIDEGFEIKQLALSWQDQIHFTLSEFVLFQGIKFQDELLKQAEDLEAETLQQEFDANFLIMLEALTGLFKDILELFCEEQETATAQIAV